MAEVISRNASTREILRKLLYADDLAVIADNEADLAVVVDSEADLAVVVDSEADLAVIADNEADLAVVVDSEAHLAVIVDSEADLQERLVDWKERFNKHLRHMNFTQRFSFCAS